MIYQCFKCGQTKDDDLDIGTEIDGEFYCKACADLGGDMNKELIEEVASWIVTSCKSDLPYQFHAKAIIALIRTATLDEVQTVIDNVRGNQSSDSAISVLDLVDEKVEQLKEDKDSE